MNPLVRQLTHAPFPALADAIRARADDIMRDWGTAMREAMPQLDRLTVAQLEDSIPKLLQAVADALASSDPQQISRLVEDAPVQGLTRFHQGYELVEMLQEDRLLRGVVVTHVEAALVRQTTPPEAAALHSTMDVMLQRAVVALVDEQKVGLRDAAERELKYLAFLSHDMNNDLNGVTLQLNLLRRRLSKSPEFADAVEITDLAQQGIRDTVTGMRRLLEQEKLRKGEQYAKPTSVDLAALAAAIVRQFTKEAKRKGLKLALKVDPDASAVTTDPDLISLVLRNLIGNAMKYAARGTVTLGVGRWPTQGAPGWAIWVADQGPGIAPGHRDRLFEAFRRGESHGQEGVGLGLAIAAQAAKVLGAQLSVESEVGKGSVFRLSLLMSDSDA